MSVLGFVRWSSRLSYLLNWPLTTGLTDFSLSSHIFASASVSWSHQSMTGLLLFGPSSANKVTLYRRLPQIFALTNDMLLEVNKLHHFCLAVRLIQLGCGNHRQLALNRISKMNYRLVHKLVVPPNKFFFENA